MFRAPLAATREVGRVLTALARLLLVVYLAGYLVASGPLLGHLWAEGRHPTPVHWAYHRLFQRLGIADHHVPAERAHGQAPGAQAGVALSPRIHQILAAPATSPFSAEATLYQSAGAYSALGPATAGWRLMRLDRIVPTGLRPEPPEKPPPFDR